jgi:hypothetical protein
MHQVYNPKWDRGIVLLELRLADYRWIAETEGAVQEESLRQALPLTVRATQSEWSGDIMDLLDGPSLVGEPAAESLPFQYPGLLVYEAQAGRLALCFGEGRWQDGFGPLRAIPVARIVAGLDRLRECGRRLQFVGAQPLTIAVADPANAASPVDEHLNEGQPVEIQLGAATARCVLLERSSPDLSRALAALLPLRGKATNTFASGPLTRFWNEAGGAEGATTLEVGGAHPASERRSLATPGYVYYMPTVPFNGLRIAARAATVMKSALPGGGRSPLLPLAKFVGDWTAFREIAADLRFTGALPMTIRFAA